MGAYLVQGGTTLYTMSRAGVATAVTLPSGTTLYGTAAQPCRATLFQVGESPVTVVVNGATKDFYLDSAGTARNLQIIAPTAAPVPTAGTTTGLTGVYKVACTFKVKDITTGATLIESGMGPLSAGTAALVNQSIALASIPASGDASVNARGMYRTLAGGNTLYPWFDIDNNTTLSEDRGVADASLSLLPTTAIRYGAPPALKLITSWKNRLWGVPRNRPDFVRWTEDRNFYGWSADNELLTPPQSADSLGVTAFIPRKDELGVGRRKGLHTIRGNSNASFQRLGISETLGPVNQESVVVVYNTGYFLTDVGIAEWNDTGLGIVSEAQVNGWFNTDTYFNRAMFPYAQGRYNPETDAVEWLLASAGSSTLDRWVAFHLRTRTWYGPHKTDAFTLASVANSPSFSGGLSDTDSLPLAVFGGTDGYLYARDSTNVLDHTTAVAMSAALPPLSANIPDMEKYWDLWTIFSRVETGGELTITPTVGTLDGATASPAQIHDLTQGKRVMPRLGRGQYAQLTLSHSATTIRPRIYGVELPYNVIGRRR